MHTYDTAKPTSFQGIYRVSGVKSKVESLCQSFEADPETVDLGEHNPHVIANVLKLYFRQVRLLGAITVQ